MNMIVRAQAIATEAHAGAKDKAGQPYIDHPAAVADKVVLYGNQDLIAAAWLHDVVEDTGWTIQALLGAGFSVETVRLVDAVTRMEGEKYLEEFIPRVINAGPWAIRLKLADLWHNTHPTRAASLKPSLAERYTRAIAMLETALEHAE
jgi:(p)ppGpp synthase/HD superfamily hydrolase